MTRIRARIAAATRNRAAGMVQPEQQRISQFDAATCSLVLRLTDLV